MNSDPLREREGNIIDICSIYNTGSTQYSQQAQYISRMGSAPPPPYGKGPRSSGDAPHCTIKKHCAPQ